MGEGSVTQSRHQQVVFERDMYKQFCEDIAQAILNEGNHPKYHRTILRKHKQDWPYLWMRIDKMVAYVRKNNDK